MERYWARSKRERDEKKKNKICLVYTCNKKAEDRLNDYCAGHSYKK